MNSLMLAVLLAAVFFANFYASSIGGASLLIMPVMFLTGIPANIAIGTNRLHRIFASGTAALKFMKEVKVSMKHLAAFCLASIFGTTLGALIVISIDSWVLKLSVSAVLLVLAVIFFLEKDIGLREKKGKEKKENVAFGSSAMFLIGVYRAIVGSAAGTFIRVYLVLKEGKTFLQAATFASVISVVSNISATMIFIWAGIIDYWIALYMIVFGIVGSYMGARIAIEKGNKFVKKIFLLLVILMSIRIIAGALFEI